MLLEVDVQSGCAALTLPASLQRTLGSEIETTLVDKVLEVLQLTMLNESLALLSAFSAGAVTYWLVSVNMQQQQARALQHQNDREQRLKLHADAKRNVSNGSTSPLLPGSPAMRRIRNSSGIRSRSGSATSTSSGSARSTASAAAVAAAEAKPAAAAAAKKSRFNPSIAERAGVVCCSSHKDMLALIQKCTEPNDAVLVVSGRLSWTGSNGSAGRVNLREAVEAQVGVGGVVEEVLPASLRAVGGLVGAVLRAQGAVAPKSIAVVVMDVTTFHGHDMLLDGVRLVEELRDCLAPGLATVIVKSRVMTRHASQVWSSQKFLHLRQTEGAWRECGPQCKVLAGVGVLPYRNTIKQVVADGCKRILEIGCADGASTRLLCTALQGAGVSLSPDAAVCGPDEGWVVGLDTGKRCVANAQ
eukprot:gene20415-34613_t